MVQAHVNSRSESIMRNDQQNELMVDAKSVVTSLRFFDCESVVKGFESNRC